MVALYVGGNKVGTLADAEALIPKFAEQRVTVELRDDDGFPLGTFTPAPEPVVPWDPTVTHEDLDRIAAGPLGKPLSQILRELGAE